MSSAQRAGNGAAGASVTEDEHRGERSPAAADGSTGSTGTTGPTGPTRRHRARARLAQRATDARPAARLDRRKRAERSDRARRDRPARLAERRPRRRIRSRGSSPAGSRRRPVGAPDAVRPAIAAGNQLIGKPYLYGGGHASFISSGYDCSGDRLLRAARRRASSRSPLDSSALRALGRHGRRRVDHRVHEPQHAYVDIAGIRLDTSRAGDAAGQSGPRWRPCSCGRARGVRGPPSRGFVSGRALRLLVNPQRRKQWLA